MKYEVHPITSHDNKKVIQSPAKLKAASEQVPGVYTYQCDVSDPSKREDLVRQVIQEHPRFNLLINNAVIVDYLRIREADYSAARVDREMQTNFIGPVGLIRLFLDHLLARPSSGIINITTGLIYAPHADMPGYCASTA